MDSKHGDVIIGIVGLLISTTIMVLLGWVAWHFIAKYW